MSIQIKQESSYVGDRRWDWSVWLAGPAAELDKIDYVTYTLHPTYPNPVQKINTREDGFRLKSGGWGEFTIYIDITQKNGESFQLSHDLKLILEPVKRPPSTVALQEARPAIKGIGKSVHRVIKAVAEHIPSSTVFVSGGVADTEAVHKLRMSLEKLNVNILSADNMPSDVPFQVQIDNLIEQSNLAVFLVSGRPSMWMNQEIETAKRHGKHIVPVLVGSGSELPETLQGFHSLHIDNLDSVADLAQGVLKL
ncbi:MAG: pYEATS domain-containing protein [Gallionella sp.]